MVLCAVAVLWKRFWPFERGPVLRDLAEASDSTIEVRKFHRVYFPFPGCIIEGLVFHHSQEQGQPLITIDRLTIRGGYLGMLAHRISRITVDGMKISIPPFGSGQKFQSSRSKVTIGEFVANGAVLEFEPRDPNKQPLRFEIHQAALRNVGWSGPMRYEVRMRNPEPPGELSAHGEFGAWRSGRGGQTPVSGEYKFEHADLGVYHGIAGILSSKGKFSGDLNHINIEGMTDTPDFEVDSNGHKVQLITEFSAYVDATHGDTFLKRVDAHFRRTHVVAHGSIAGVRGRKGKTAMIQLETQNGRIEDLLGLFVKDPRAPMSGMVSLKANVEIPPGDEPFLRKVKLTGDFGIGGGNFTKAETQEDVNKLSAAARGDNRDDAGVVISDLAGQVALQSGIAGFSALSFGIPGATALMHGKYGVIDHKVDLHGTMKVDTKISKTTTGMKSFLLKMMDPFFKKARKGEIVPIHIAGTYEHPQFGLDIGGGGNSTEKETH